MRLVMLAFFFVTTASAASAGNESSVRVIPITQQSAAESAKVISAAHLIGMPPQGKPNLITTELRNARANPPGKQSDLTYRARVQVITRVKTQALKEAYLVSEERR